MRLAISALQHSTEHKTYFPKSWSLKEKKNEDKHMNQLFTAYTTIIIIVRRKIKEYPWSVFVLFFKFTNKIHQ